MKLYLTTSPPEIKTWLWNADKRAKQLGYAAGTYLTQLFVTGALGKNFQQWIDECPMDIMVFSNEALEGLFRPFGNGIIKHIVESRNRTKAKDESVH